jgi:hypothetical protein
MRGRVWLSILQRISTAQSIDTGVDAFRFNHLSEQCNLAFAHQFTGVALDAVLVLLPYYGDVTLTLLDSFIRSLLQHYLVRDI